MSDKKIRVGIIGTGSIAGAHLGQYLKFDDVEIVAGADIIPGKADDFFAPHEQIHARTYTNHLEMLEKEDLDVVSVCTYNREHCRCTIDALEHGCDVLLEKPMSVTLDEAVEMRRAEKRTGKFISVGFQPRFDANMRMIKSICESGTLGEISRPEEAAAAVFRDVLLSRIRPQVSAHSVISDAILSIWCSTPSDIRSRLPYPATPPISLGRTPSILLFRMQRDSALTISLQHSFVLRAE